MKSSLFLFTNVLFPWVYKIFRFKSRKQTLNQMGAKTRLGLDWLKRFKAFHQNVGTSFKKYKPLEAYKEFDYYHLLRTVESLGGFKNVDSNNRWSEVYKTMDVDHLPLTLSTPAEAASISTASLLKSAYLDLIYPFEYHIGFLNSVGVVNADSKLSDCKLFLKNPHNKPKAPNTVAPSSPHLHHTTQSKPLLISQETELSIGITSRLQQTKDKNDTYRIQKSIKPKTNVLQSYSASSLNVMKPKSHSGKPSKFTHEKELSLNLNRPKSSRVEEKNNSTKLDDSDSEYVSVCKVCDNTCSDTSISCRMCDEEFHESCISNNDIYLSEKRLSDHSKSKWTCPLCITGSCEFGFEKGDEYTLKTFRQMADDFKNKLIKKQHLEELDEVELECKIEEMFWNYIDSINNTVSVEYGSDISSPTSGFPLSVQSVRNKYARDPWNLNNLPLNKDSLFSNLNSDISGMNIPWMYVGMVFSTFCWHSEDHYSYSVNYQHLGDTKTWYGVPGKDAELFESSMKEIAPELFGKQPDILSQLVTMVSPKALTEKGVSVYVIDQKPGEFVITLPKAYHGGFNHGFNMNEAVNFAPPSWLPFGEESAKTYQLQHRAPVFSFERLMIRTALLDSRKKTASWFSPYFLKFSKAEIEMRKNFLDKYPTIQTSIIRTELSEEEYQCEFCHALTYLSWIVAPDHPTSFGDDSLIGDVQSKLYSNAYSKEQGESQNGAPTTKSEHDIENLTLQNKENEHPSTAYLQNQSQLKCRSFQVDIQSSNVGRDVDMFSHAKPTESDKKSGIFCLLHAPKEYFNKNTKLHIRYTDDELMKIYDTIVQRLT